MDTLKGHGMEESKQEVTKVASLVKTAEYLPSVSRPLNQIEVIPVNLLPNLIVVTCIRDIDGCRMVLKYLACIILKKGKNVCSTALYLRIEIQIFS